jgi:hypothetical protein
MAILQKDKRGEDWERSKKQRSYGYWGAIDVAQGPLFCLVQRSFFFTAILRPQTAFMVKT